MRPDLVIYGEANNEIARHTESLAAREGLTAAADTGLAAQFSKLSWFFDLVYKNISMSWMTAMPFPPTPITLGTACTD